MGANIDVRFFILSLAMSVDVFLLVFNEKTCPL